MLPVSRGIYSRVSAWPDGAEANLYGEVFRRFIKEWLQSDVDRRRIKGVEISSLFPLSSADTSVVKRFAQANVSQCSYWRASAYVGGPSVLTWYGIYHLSPARTAHINCSGEVKPTSPRISSGRYSLQKSGGSLSAHRVAENGHPGN